MRKIILLILFFIIFVNNCSSINSLLYEIENVEKSQWYEFENNIFTEIKLLDDSDRITEINIILENNLPNNTGIITTYPNNISYIVYTNKYNFLNLIPYTQIIHNSTFIHEGNNYTLFSENKTHLSLINEDILIKQKYDLGTGNSTFSVLSTYFILDNLDYSTKNFNGLPASSVIFNGLSKFKLKIKVEDIGQKMLIKSKRDKLSSISSFLYDVITLKVPFTDIRIVDDNDTLIFLFSIFDLFILSIIVVFNIIFIYPYLILIYLLSLANFYTAFKSNSNKEFVLYYTEYWKNIVNLFYQLLKTILEFIINLITALINLIRG